MKNKEMVFNIGDKVKKSDGTGFEKTLSLYSTIISIMAEGGNSYCYKVEDSKRSYRYGELILEQRDMTQEQEKEFKVGDKVTFKSGGAVGDESEYMVIRKKAESLLGAHKYYYKVKGVTHSYYYDELELYKENNKTTLTDFTIKELNEKLKTIEKERMDINKAIGERKKMEEEKREKNDLKVALKTIIKRMEELGMNISELIKD